MEVILLADKYDMPFLVKKCEAYLENLDREEELT
jgi:hypothetical protein